MFKRMGFLIAACCVVVLFSGGCILTSMFGGPESPRPKEYQVEASKEIATTSVVEVMKGQLGKQEGIENVAIEALKAIKDADTQFKAAAITNIVANTANEIRRADGSAKLLSRLSGSASKSISEMSAVEYLAYTAGQTAVAISNKEKLAKGIKAGFEWTKSSFGQIAGGATGVGGLIALGIGMLRRGKTIKTKEALLKSTGNVVNKFAVDNQLEGLRLKNMLAKAAAKLPVDADKEFGIG